ncbi:MAG: lipase maturation factor family protein [Candidatus Udaeobacter sp.]
MIWDGECHFCRRWIERWREITAGKVDYATYQQAGTQFAEIPFDHFKRAIAFIEADGETFFGAEAVYRSLRYRSSRKWLAWSYDHVPGFAPISEAAYKFIARHRGLGSTITRLLWGNDVRPPTYFWARRWFLRLLGLIYLIAFVSLWVQMDGLVGSSGISPVNRFLPAVQQQLGSDAYCLLPTLCWFDSSNAFLHLLCEGGVVFSLLLVLGIAPALSLVVLFIFYLSLAIAGQVFLSFQWDVLLLETGFLSIFFAPWQLWPRDLLWWKGSAPSVTASPVSRAGLFLLKFLLFKLMLMSGVVKLTSGDDSWGWLNHSFHWSALTALDYHYWSQPLPTVFAWWADKSPEWFKHFSVAFCLVVEIIAPFFIWAPGRLRLIAAGLMIFLQTVIALTGNYCFFNLLTIALCLLLVDDSVVASLCRGISRNGVRKAAAQRRCYSRLAPYAALAVLAVTFPINAWLIFSAFKPQSQPPGWLAKFYGQLEPFRIVNGYGLFRVMTKDRCEIVIEGSRDGVEWTPYEFKWKPGDVKRAPGWCAPHQPRLDWQMWFAALETPEQNPWFIGLIVRLLEGSRDVTGLLAHDPFPDKPPHFIRAMFYRYRFTTSEERGQTGAWWKRQELREYLPTISADQLH